MMHLTSLITGIKSAMTFLLILNTVVIALLADILQKLPCLVPERTLLSLSLLLFFSLNACVLVVLVVPMYLSRVLL